MSTNYHTPIPGPPAQPEATSELFNSRFSDLDSGISGKVDSAGNGSNITSEVSVAGTRRNLTSGGALKVIFSEIQKWLSDMKAVAFSASYNDLIDQPTAMTPTTHAATHKTGGSDALKAVDIGAVSEVLPGSNVTVSKNPDTGAVTINAAGGGSGGSAHIIANDGAALPNQGTLDFGTGLTAADDPATFKTAVTLDMGAIQIGKAQINDFPAAMTPTAHATTHKIGGSDALTLMMAQISDAPVFSTILWTPILAGATTAGNYVYKDRTGKCVRVGSLVFAFFDLTISAIVASGTGFATIKGFPAALAPSSRGVSSINIATGSFQHVTGLDILAAGFYLTSYTVSGTQIRSGYSSGVLSPTADSRLIGAAIYPVN